ncbi:MAG: helix-turn-helix transcriptional regulator [Rhizobacter sp.]|nr:helix-turn-helix transcriptional regulator [Ferruginibacter sp.]
MNGLKDIRLKHNLSMSAFAMLLQVSKSLVNMAEAGKRSLPINALLKLATLQQNGMATRSTMKTSTTPILEFEAAGQLATTKALQKHVRNCRHALTMLERRLQGLQIKYDNAIATLHMVAGERQNSTMANEDPMYTSWLNGREAAAKLQLYKCSDADITLLQIKADGLRAQRHSAEEKLQSTSATPFR